MRICLVNRDFGFHGTGVTRIATEVSKELERRGHEVIRVSTGGMESSLYSYAFHTAVGVAFKLPRDGVDVYHALATLEAMWLPPEKSIATYLDLFTSTNPDRAGAGMGYSRWKLEVGRRYFALGAKIASRCRFLVCISDKTKQDVMDHIGVDERKLKVIRLGISDSLRPSNSRRPKFPYKLTIGTLGQLDKRKRVNLLIDAFKKTDIPAQLLIAGKGPDEPLLRLLSGDDERIHFLGLVSEDKLNQFYNSLDVFVFPSGIEGYGLPPVEAMACGKPVVVLDDAILPDEIRTRCVSVPDLSCLFDGSNELERIMCANRFAYNDNLNFAREHRWENCVGEYIKLYEEIAK